MRIGRLIGLGVSALLFASFCLITPVSAENSNNILVDNIFNLTFKTATNLEVTANIDVKTITIYGTTTYDTSGIQTIAASTDPDDVEDLGEIKGELREGLLNQLGTIFEDANVAPLTKKPIYKDSRFHDSYDVNLTTAFFGLEETVNIHDFVNGVLDMGAVITNNFNLQAEKGWNNTFIFILPKSFIPVYADTPDFNPNTNEITWILKNWDGQNPSDPATLKTRYKNPTTSDLITRNIHLGFKLDARDPVTTSLKTIVSAKNIGITDYDILPDFITNLDFLPADGIRLFIENNLFSWNSLYQKTIRPIENITISKIENSSLNQTLKISFDWDDETTMNCSTPYNVTHMDNNPPVKAEFIDNDIDLQICNISTRATFGLINAGANINISQKNINFGDKLDEIGYPYNVTLYMPSNISLAGKNIYIWNQSHVISGEFESEISPEYYEEKIDTLIEIEISNTDLNLFSFFTGKTELTMALYMEETRNYSVIRLPDEFFLPKKLNLNYLNADAFRLGIEENVFDENNVTSFLDNEKQLFEQRLKTIFQKSEWKLDGLVDRETFDESIDMWDGDVSDMDSDKPVKVVSYVHNSIPILFNLSVLPPKFEISNQSFNLTGLQNQDVIYRVVFPHGTNVLFNDSLDRAVMKETDDGRKYIEISFNASEAILVDDFSFKMVPSILFIISVFIPCIVSLIITIVLVVVIYLIRKKRKRGKKVEPLTDTSEDEDYEDENYYVPPPPSR